MKFKVVSIFLGLIFVGLLGWWMRPALFPSVENRASSSVSPLTTSVSTPARNANTADTTKISNPARSTEGDQSSIDATDTARGALLESLLTAKNDNDPRYDSELRNLPTGTKTLFRKQYSDLSSEKRNERGTIVFLLGRNLNEKRDFQFLESVLTEKPCLSLSKCEKEPLPGEHDSHLERVNEMTLAYPQVVALKAAARFLKDPNAAPALKADAMRVLETGRNSSIPVVAKTAETLLEGRG